MRQTQLQKLAQGGGLANPYEDYFDRILNQGGISICWSNDDLGIGRE